jgi:hypothetical protein
MPDDAQSDLARARAWWNHGQWPEGDNDGVVLSLAAEFAAVEREARAELAALEEKGRPTDGRPVRHWNGIWGEADELLARAQKMVEEMQAQNSDEYGLLKSAHEHITSARDDLDADLK